MGKTSKHKGNKTSRPYNTKIGAQREVSDTQNLSREKSRASSSKYVPRHLKSSSNRSGVGHFKPTETNTNLKPLSLSLKQKDFAAEDKEIQRNNIQEMQQQDISGSESEFPKMSSNNQDENLDNSVPDSDSSSMKEDNGGDAPVMESREVTGEDGTSDVEKPIIEENSFSTNVRGGEIEENLRNTHLTSGNSESQSVEIQSEANNDKELIQLGLSSDDNYDPVIDNHEAEMNEELTVSSPDETEINVSDTNGSLEVDKETDNGENNYDFYSGDVKENNPEEINGTMEGLDEIVSKQESAESDINPKESNIIESIHETPLPELVNKDNQSELHSDNPYSVSSLNSYSWAGNIRSVSARRPFRKSSITPECLSTSGSRGNTPGKVLSSICENAVSPSVHMSKNVFASMKRKAFENDSIISPKKLKVNDSQHSTFLSMVSTPLRLLKNKISDRIIENSKVAHDEKHVNGDSEEGIKEPEAKPEIHMKDKNVLIEENQGISQDTDTYKRWCTIM